MSPSSEDLRACSTLLNTLHAELQGVFVRESVLSRLGHEAAEPAFQQRLQAAVDRVAEWMGRLWKSDPVLRCDGWADPQAMEEALRWLSELADRTEAVGRRMEPALDTLHVDGHEGQPVPEAAEVLGAWAGAVHAFDHELNGVLRHAVAFGEDELAASALDRKPESELQLRVVHSSLDRLDSPAPPGCELLGELQRGAAHLPELLAMKADSLRALIEEVRGLR